MTRIGKIIARSWTARSRRRRRSKIARARPRRRALGLIATLGRAAERASTKKRALPAPAPAAVPAVAATPVALPAPPPPALPAVSRTGLRTSDLIRPEPRLRSSMEGFFLDQRSEHTRRAYGKDLKRFVKYLLAREAERGPEPLERQVFVSYKESLLGEGLEHTTVDRHLASLRALFGWLAEDGHVTRNPVEGVRFMNPKRLSKTLGFSDEEVRKILRLPNLHRRSGALHYALLMVLFYCGLRRSELCGLRTSHLGVERGHRVLRLRGKGNAERIVVAIPAVWNAIRHYLYITAKNATRDQYLFTPVRNNRTGRTEKPLDPSMVYYVVAKYAREAGITHRVSPHSCRATAISNARDHHVSDRAIQEFAGWSSPDMITRYDKRRSAVEGAASHRIAYGAEEGRAPRPPDGNAAGPEAPRELPVTADGSPRGSS